MVALVTLDVEVIVRKLSKAEVHPDVIEVFVELHETQRALEKLVNELMTHQAALLDATKLLNAGFKDHKRHLEKIEKKFQGDDFGLVTGDRKN
jgi:hypothetical protein